MLLLLFYIPSKQNIYQHVHNPAEENSRSSVLGSFYFKLSPPGIPGTDGDSLVDTQQAGATNGHSPGLSVDILNNFAFSIIEKIFPPKHIYCPWGSCREHDQGVGYKQIHNDQICGSQPAHREVKEEIMVKKREISQDSKHILG